MKFTCVRENLERACSLAERFTGKNAVLPILASILLEVRERILTVTGTNLECAIQITVPGTDMQPGKISIPAKVAVALLQSTREEKIHVEERGGNLLIKTDRRDARINGLPADDFPLLPHIKKTASCFVDVQNLGRGLGSVLPAVSLSEFKPEYTGVLFRADRRALRLAATDTFRLAEQIVALQEQNEDEPFSFILPHRVAAELVRVLGGEENIVVSLGDNQVLFEREGMRIISRTIDGYFPEYDNIIPKRFDTTCFINRTELLHAVRSSSIFASKLQDITLALEGNECEITSANQEIGAYKTRIPISSSGKDARVSFNYRYLIDGLNMLSGEDIFFGMNGEHAPSLLHDRESEHLRYMVMPIRVT